MHRQLFNLAPTTLYRTPLRLVEELEGEEKKSWDLGYHHAIRKRGKDPSGAEDQDAYEKGFQSGSGGSSSSKEEPAAPAGGRSLFSIGPAPKESQPEKRPSLFSIGGGGGGAPVLPSAQSSLFSMQVSDKPYTGPKPSRAPDVPDVLPPLVDKASLSQHTGISRKVGLDGRIFGGLDPNNMAHVNRLQNSMKEAGQEAAEVLKKQDPNLQIGELYGCGMSGCAYGGPTDPDGTPTVIKMDKGANEATMARLLLKDPELGRLSSVPRYISVHETGVKDKVTGLPIHAIHREDIHDLPDRRETTSGLSMKTFFGSYGHTLLHMKLATKAPNMTREELLKAYDDGAQRYRRDAGRSWELKRQFERVDADVRKLLEKGIVPCDLHEDNWGVRKSTGEVVMRDVGCSNFTKDVTS